MFQVFVTLTLIITCLNSALSIENFVGYRTDPIMESEDKNSLFSFGRAKPIDEENSPVLNIQPKNGPKMNVPRGIFHYVDRERDFGSNFKLPDMGSPVDFSGRMKTKDNFVSKT